MEDKKSLNFQFFSDFVSVEQVFPCKKKQQENFELVWS